MSEKAENGKHSVLQSTLMMTSSALILQVLGFIYRIILSRLLTSEQMGVYGLMMPIYALLSAGTLSGFSVAAVRTTADYAGSALGFRKRAAEVLHRTMRMYILMFCAAAILFSLFSESVAAMLGQPRLQTALLLLLPCLLMTAFENILKSVFQGMQNVVPSMISECSEQIVRILSVGMLLYVANAKTGSSANACALIVCGMILSEVASDVILGIFAKDFIGIKNAGASPSISSLSILRCALPVCAGNACGMLLSSISGAIVPVALQRYGMTAAQSLSAYGELSGMLLPLLNTPGAFVYPLTAVMLPRITEALANRNALLFRRRVVKTLLSVSSVEICAQGAAVLFSPALCRICFKTAYPAGSEAIIRLGIASLFGFIASGAACVLNAMGKQGTLVLVGTILGAAEIPILSAATAQSGVSGYADVSVVLSFLQAGILLYAVKKFCTSAQTKSTVFIPKVLYPKKKTRKMEN